MFRLEDGIARPVAMLGAPPAFVEFLQRGHRPGPNTALVRAARSGRAIHVHDMRTEKGYLEGEPIMVAGADLAGMRTLLNVPMLKDNEPIGAIGIYRTEVVLSPKSRSSWCKTCRPGRHRHREHRLSTSCASAPTT
jgi:hypothetical protein